MACYCFFFSHLSYLVPASLSVLTQWARNRINGLGILPSLCGSHFMIWRGIFSTAACSFHTKAILMQTPVSPEEPSPFVSLPLSQQGGLLLQVGL